MPKQQPTANNAVANQDLAPESLQHPLANTSKFESFPLDTYVPAVLIAYFIADAPPSPLSDTDDVIPSVRFLFSNGTIRKWTRWYRVSYHKKSGLKALFKDVPDLEDFLTTETPFHQQYQIFVEAQPQSEYTEITKIKINDKPLPSDLPIDTIFYDKEYVPYKVVRVFGKPAPVTYAAMKINQGVDGEAPTPFVWVINDPTQMQEPPSGKK